MKQNQTSEPITMNESLTFTKTITLNYDDFLKFLHEKGLLIRFSHHEARSIFIYFKEVVREIICVL
jgi:hypothetical protein